MRLSWKKHRLTLSGVFLCFWLSGAWAQEETRLYQKLAKVLYQNECGAKPENLLYWSPYESFPSLGIGHFIWLPEDQKSQPFKETFPAFIQFYQKLYAEMPKSPVLPSFLRQKPLILPWQSRKAFLQAEGSSQMLALKQFLWQTRQQQSEFVVQRFWQQWQGVLKEVEPREALIKSLELLRDFKGADSRRALQAMASPCQKAQQRSCPLKAPPEGGLSQIPSLGVIFSYRIDIRLRKDALMLKIWLAQKPSDLISTSLLGSAD